MLEILSITAPIFILIGLGYLSVMTRLISRETTRGMGVFVVTIALPALILRGMANKSLADSMDGDFLAGYALASLTLFVLGVLFYRRVRGAPLADSSMAGLGMSSSNSGFVGVSICTMVLGSEPASRAVAMTILVESMLMIPLAMAIADASAGQGEVRLLARIRQTLKRLMRSPLLIAIFAGVLLAGFRIPVPSVALRVIDMLAPEMRQAGIIFAAAPMLSILPILGMRYGLEDHCSATLLLATVLSFISISATIALIA